MQAGHDQFKTKIIQTVAIIHAGTGSERIELDGDKVFVDALDFGASVAVGVMVNHYQSTVLVQTLQVVEQRYDGMVIML